MSGIAEAIREVFGESVSVTGRRAVSGGDCNEAYALTLSNGETVFMKANRAEYLHFFTTEQKGLALLASTGEIRVPRVLAYGVDEAEHKAFLLMEMVQAGQRTGDFWEDFGMRLGAMHRWDAAQTVPNGPYGLDHDNIIGFRPQINTPHTSFIDFYRDCRLAPQIRDAEAAGYLSAADLRMADNVMTRLSEWMIEPTHPSVLHGDLWRENFMVGPDGRAMLIDPAVYVGHPEADIAMTELFSGFPATFYDAYEAAAPLQPGYEDRRDLYHLYQMLNHLNQFGLPYYHSVHRILQRYAAA